MRFYAIVLGLMVLALLISYGFGFAIDAFLDWRERRKRDAALKRAAKLEPLFAAVDRERAAILRTLAEDAKAKMAERQKDLNGARVDFRAAHDGRIRW